LNDGFLLSHRLVFLDDFVGLAGFHDALVVLLVFFGQFPGKKVKVRFAQNVLQFTLVRLEILLVGECEPSLKVFPENVLGHRLHQRMIKGFRVP